MTPTIYRRKFLTLINMGISKTLTERKLANLIKAYEDKNDYLKYQADCTEITFDDFMYAIFCRDTIGGRLVEPFEQEGCREYLLWRQEHEKKRQMYAQLKEDEIAAAGAEGREPRGVKMDWSIDYSAFEGDWKWRYNPIVTWCTKSGDKTQFRSHIWLNGETGMDFVEDRRFAIVAPVTFVGRNRTAKNARFVYGLTVDLDDVSLTNLKRLFKFMHSDNDDIKLPLANIIVSSGTGFHLYYLFDSPIPMWGRAKKILKQIKYYLIKLIWQPTITTRAEHLQFQGLFQGYRIPGSLTKFGEKVRAFSPNGTRLFKPSEFLYYKNKPNRKKHIVICDEKKDFDLTFDDLDYIDDVASDPIRLEMARKKWPDWYQRRVINKEPRRYWKVKRDLYDWWKRILRKPGAVKVGHRYNCLFCLAVYAAKCEIPFDELKEDALSYLDYFEALTNDETNHFKEEEVMDALKGYKEELKTLPIGSIKYLSGISIERNKPRGRSKTEHVAMLHAIQKVVKRKPPRKSDAVGRPKGSPNKERVEAWCEAHPDGRVCDCAKALGLSLPTARKYFSGTSLCERVRSWRREHPSGSMNLCAKDIGVCWRTVRAHWD